MKRKTIQAVLIHATLIVTLIAVAFPMYYAFVMATHTHQDAYAFPPILRPGNQLWNNMKVAWERVNMGTLLKNSTIIAGVVALGKIVFSILAAFAFTHFKFRDRKSVV